MPRVFKTLILALILIFGGASLVFPQNLVLNGSAETGSGEDPDAFYRVPNDRNVLTWDQEVARSGNASLKARSGTAGEVAWYCDAFPVSEGEEYTFRMWVKQEGVNVGPANDDQRWGMVVRFGTSRAADGELSGILPPDNYTWLDQSAADLDWYLVEAQFVAPSGAHYADWDVRKRSRAGGRVWVDDISCTGGGGDALSVGENMIFGVPGGIACIVTYEGDANGNATAALRYRSAGETDWTDVAEPDLSDGRCTGEISGLVGGSAYDVQIEFSDSDGVNGINPVEVSDISVPEVGDVVVESIDDHSFRVRFGAYCVAFGVGDGAVQTDGRVLLYPYDESPESGVEMTFGLLERPFSVVSTTVAQQTSDEGFVIRLENVGDGNGWSGTLTFALDRLNFMQVEVEFMPSTEQVAPATEQEFLFSASQENVRIPFMQMQFECPAALVIDPVCLRGTAFVYEDLTALNSYFESQLIAPSESVRGNQRGFGFQRPFNDARTLPANETVTLLKTSLLLEPGVPVGINGEAKRYLSGLQEAVTFEPAPVYDWSSVVTHVFEDLQTPECIVSVNGVSLPRAYVNDGRNGAEALAIMDILVPLRRYLSGHPDDEAASALNDLITPGLPRFFNNDHQTFVNNYPNEGISSGNSWYSVQLHIDLARLALLGDDQAESLLISSVPELMELAHNVNYEFPIGFNYGSNTAIHGRQDDVSGGYAYLMLLLHQLTGSATYRSEAEAALNVFEGTDHNVTHEVHITVAGAVAAERFFQLTGETRWRDLSQRMLAITLRRFWMWECDYGWAESYTTFGGVAAMPGIGYIAAKEQREVWDYLNELLEFAGDESDWAELVQALVAHMEGPIFYSLPPNLPSEMISGNPDIGENLTDLYVPLEDIRDGFRLSGIIGQEIYGAGGPIAMAAGYVSDVRNDSAAQCSLPLVARLEPVYPNPANPSAVVRLWLPKHSAAVTVDVVNVLGQRVGILHCGALDAGHHQFMFTGKSKQRLLASGLYFVRLQVDGKTQVQKMLLQR